MRGLRGDHGMGFKELKEPVKDEKGMEKESLRRAFVILVWKLDDCPNVGDADNPTKIICLSMFRAIYHEPNRSQ
jgi:hypothetical protein